MSPAFNYRQLLALLLFVRRMRRRKEFWISPLFENRSLNGTFTKHIRLEENYKKFFGYYRMTPPTFKYILEKIKMNIVRENTPFRSAISPEEMLAVTLRYLASGNTFTDLSYYYSMGIATISEIVSEVCNCIWAVLGPEYLAPPTTEKWRSIADNFSRHANFPNCLGAVDGKHIRIQNFDNSGSMYLNYKNYFSIVLMAIVDSDYKFVYVDIGAYGKDCDSAIFQRTNIYKLLSENLLNIPPPAPLATNLNTTRTPYVFIGDEAFQLTPNFLRPYGGTNLNVKQRIYNYRHCRARRYVECAFGILAHKWRIFQRPLNVSRQLSKDIVKACVVLHNVVRERDGHRPEGAFIPITTALGDMPIIDDEAVQSVREANNIRQEFADYFSSPQGSLPWQMSKI